MMVKELINNKFIRVINKQNLDNAFKIFTIAAKKYKNQSYQELAEKIAKDEQPSALELLTK